MILEFDLGNTRVKWRIVDDSSIIQDRGVFLFEENHLKDKVAEIVTGADKVRLASVRSTDIENEIEAICRSKGVVFFTAKTLKQCAGVVNAYEDPTKMGVDRWLAMVAGFNVDKKPCCVIDCGSAITVDFINPCGLHQGGYIVPGFNALKKSLSHSTERVYFSLDRQLDSCSPGLDTQQAVNHGSLSMVVSWLNSLCEKVRYDYGEKSGLYLTGGDAELVVNHLNYKTECLPDLVMEGLAYCERARFEGEV